MTKDDLNHLIALGEGQTLEFKRSPSEDFGREMVAFANSLGGTLLIGVDEHWFPVTFHRQRAEQKSSNQTTHEPTAGVKTSMKPRVKTGEKILSLIKEHPEITRVQIAEKTGISLKGVDWQLARMKARGGLKRIGADKGGHWEVAEFPIIRLLK